MSFIFIEKVLLYYVCQNSDVCLAAICNTFACEKYFSGTAIEADNAWKQRMPFQENFARLVGFLKCFENKLKFLVSLNTAEPELVIGE